MTCGHFLGKWKHFLARSQDHWLIYWLPKNTIWFNPAARRRRGIHATLTLQAALARLSSADADKATEALERSISTGEITFAKLMVPVDHQRELATVAHQYLVCENCHRKCGLVLIFVSRTFAALAGMFLCPL